MQLVLHTRALILTVSLILLQQEHNASAILNDIFEIIDLQNLDLANFEYFRNLPSQNPKTAGQANPLQEHFLKKKAMFDYVEHLFFGLSPLTQPSEIEFNPHFGRAWRPYFEGRHGKRGAKLVEMLGRGYSLEQLRRQGAIPRDFGTRNYPTR
ncbi:uncharacterized protein [Eurosta solidaginis]|uniref:uncharacterized protein n=1 Tax=Eurosta solidaginis TaxID=178769 RepID=UPI00353129B3